jgi:hypothetical protein
MFPISGVPRLCVFAHLVEVSLREGKASGSKQSKSLDVDFIVSRGEKLSMDFTVYHLNYFDINTGKAVTEYNFCLTSRGLH